MRGWLTLGMMVAAESVAATPDVLAAHYDAPTTRYAHGILGDAIEFGDLIMQTSDGEVTVHLPETLVFEDVAPRIVDIDADGIAEVLVVESALNAGARIAIYDGDGGVKAATPYFGQRNRWYAPIGVADLDGDGRVEVAFIDRPHLAKTLRVWRYDGGDFSEIANLPGVTNHRIGEPDIAGGIRDCGAGPEMIVATEDWSRVLAVTFNDGFDVTVLGPHKGRESFAAAMSCYAG